MYFNTEDISHITSKTEMQSFEQLNGPIVVTMPIYQGKGLFGHNEWGKAYKEEGYIFIVYDWENDKIFDWAFLKGMHGLSNWRAVELGNPIKYYSAGVASKTIGCLNPQNGKISVIKNPVQGILVNVNSDKQNRNQFGLLSTNSFKNDSYYYNINVFDSNTQSINEIKIELPVNSINLDFPYIDDNGDYWFAYSFKDDNYLAKYECKTNTQESFYIRPLNKNSTCEELFQTGIVNNHILLSDGVKPLYPNIIVCNLDDPSEQFEIPRPVKISENDFPLRTVFVNDEPYCIFVNTDDSYINIIYRLNPTTWQFEYEASFEFQLSETIYARGTRIYMINSWNEELFRCKYYDVATKEIGGETMISLEEIVSN